MTIQTIVFNPLQVNTYLLSDQDGNAILIDPANFDPTEDKRLKNLVESQGLQVKKILFTHLHFDHLLGAGFAKNLTGGRCYASQGDIDWLKNIEGYAAAFGLSVQGKDFELDGYLYDGQIIEVGQIRLEVIATPGHSIGGLSFYLPSESCLFSGDSLFATSIGRCDLPGGNYNELIESIQKKLLCLPNETVVYPGHGSQTSIAFEKQHNPYL